MNWQRPTGQLLIALGVIILTLKLSHTYDPAPAIERLSAKASPAAGKFVHRAQPDRVVYGGLVILPILLGALFLFTSKSKAKSVATSAFEDVPQVEIPKPAKHKATKPATI